MKIDNNMRVPKITKISINMGLGDAKENKNCLRKNCQGKISKIFISNRSTFFCNLCQK